MQRESLGLPWKQWPKIIRKLNAKEGTDLTELLTSDTPNQRLSDEASFTFIAKAR